jgi:hypothetical protein
LASRLTAMTFNWATTLHDDITIWRSTPDSYGGFTYAAPETTLGRWQDGGVIVRTSSGDQVIGSSTIYLTVDVDENDWVALGTFTDLEPVDTATQVLKFFKSPDLRNLEYVRKAAV